MSGVGTFLILISGMSGRDVWRCVRGKVGVLSHSLTFLAKTKPSLVSSTPLYMSIEVPEEVDAVVDATDEDREIDGVWLDRSNWRSIGEGRRSFSLSESGVFLFLGG